MNESESFLAYKLYVETKSAPGSGKPKAYLIVLERIGKILRKNPSFAFIPDDITIIKNFELLQKLYEFVKEEQKKPNGGIFDGTDLTKGYWDPKYSFCSAAIKDFIRFRMETYDGKMTEGEYEALDASILEVRQLITYGAPGTGKSFKTKNETKGETVFRTTFHPDSDYATFVGAYKPTMKDDRVAYTEVSRKESSGAFGVVEKREQKFGICYKFVDQVFTKAYTAAWKYQKAAGAGVAPKKVYLIIEEINRGNCAQVFGDLFQLLDRNPQGFSEYGVIPDADFGKHIGEELAKEASVIDPTRKSQINALYPEIESGVDLVDEVLAGRMLLFPDNLYIRATMNTSDQSLFPMDSAFKRRWDWDYVAIKDHPEEEWEIEIDATTHYRWWDFLEVINKEIFKATSSEDKQLGYFFARTPNKKIDLNMFVNKVVFYLWNSVFKDCYTDCEFLKEDKDHYFTFTSFFNKGVIDPERAKKFLGKLKGLQSKEAKAAASRNPAATTGTDAVAATTDAGAENA